MYMDRLKRHNPVLNCVVSFTDDLAMNQARAADAEIEAGRYKGPLHGIPWGAKDIIAAKGYRTTWGSGAYQEQVLDYDATVIEQVRDAGAVLIAKLTSGEFAAGSNWFGGRTNNPVESRTEFRWVVGPDRVRRPVADAWAFPSAPRPADPFSVLPQTAVSLDFRPTLGRVSRYGVMALSWTQDRVGPMCRYAEDCAIVMAAIAKQDDRDMSVQDIPFNWDASLDITQLRIGYLPEYFDAVEDPTNRAINQATLDQLKALGVDPIPFEIPRFPVSVTAHNVEMAVFFDEFVRSDRVGLMTRAGRAAGFRAARLIPAVEYLQSQRARMMMMMDLAKATEGVDVFLSPRGGRGGGGGATQPEGLSASSQCNYATYPAIAVPNGFNDEGMPTSMTFFARPFGESELLAVAKAYQDASGHHLKHPEITE